MANGQAQTWNKLKITTKHQQWSITNKHKNTIKTLDLKLDNSEVTCHGGFRWGVLGGRVCKWGSNHGGEISRPCIRWGTINQRGNCDYWLLRGNQWFGGPMSNTIGRGDEEEKGRREKRIPKNEDKGLHKRGSLPKRCLEKN